MKTARFVLVAVLIATAFAAVPVTAETSSTNVNIPFNFQVGATILPAGDYTVAMVTDKAIVLQHKGGEAVAVALTNAVSGKSSEARPHFLFNRYGKSYFLAEAWLRNTDSGRAMMVSDAEREIAGKVRKTHTILLASK